MVISLEFSASSDTEMLKKPNCFHISIQVTWTREQAETVHCIHVGYWFVWLVLQLASRRKFWWCAKKAWTV
jgi:hypothetical protein